MDAKTGYLILGGLAFAQTLALAWLLDQWYEHREQITELRDSRWFWLTEAMRLEGLDKERPR